jgi:Holliday junction DNA helicase RuvA
VFAFLRGAVALKGAGAIALDVGGVGYQVHVPEPVQRRLAVGQEVTLITHCHIREDAFTIFGFLREEEKRVFDMLLGVSGIGPKMAMAVVSAMSVAEFGRALLESDVDAFTKISGVGKKTAQRIVLEMKAKLGQDAELKAIMGEDAGSGDSGDRDDVIDALLALGCTPGEAKKAATGARRELGDKAAPEDVVRAALRSLARVA